MTYVITSMVEINAEETVQNLGDKIKHYLKK